jgi:hypothetical protein
VVIFLFLFFVVIITIITAAAAAAAPTASAASWAEHTGLLEDVELAHKLLVDTRIDMIAI